MANTISSIWYECLLFKSLQLFKVLHSSQLSNLAKAKPTLAELCPQINLHLEKCKPFKDFSSKSITFNNCIQAEHYFSQYDKEEEGPKRSSSDIEKAWALLKKELVRTLEILLNLHKKEYGRQYEQVMRSITGKLETCLANNH